MFILLDNGIYLLSPCISHFLKTHSHTYTVYSNIMHKSNLTNHTDAGEILIYMYIVLSSSGYSR